MSLIIKSYQRADSEPLFVRQCIDKDQGVLISAADLSETITDVQKFGESVNIEFGSSNGSKFLKFTVVILRNESFSTIDNFELDSLIQKCSTSEKKLANSPLKQTPLQVAQSQLE